MLYLVKSNGFYKIGYTSNVRKRIENYKCENPSFEFIGIIKGDRNYESKLHFKYKEYCVNDTEWMKLPKKVLNEIKNIFNSDDKVELITQDQCEFLKNKDITHEEISFLEACLKYSEEPTEKQCFNKFYYNIEFEKSISEDLSICDSEIQHTMSKLKEKYVVLKYGDGYMINPNFLYRGNPKFKKSFKVSKALIFTFGDDEELKEGVIFEPEIA